MERHWRYRPSPSAVLLKQGPIVEDSYFYVAEGKLHFNEEANQEPLDCEFEVGYGQDGMARAVVYIEPIRELKRRESINRRDGVILDNAVQMHSKRLEGVEKYFELHVLVDLLTPPGWMGWGLGDGKRYIFNSKRFVVSALETTPRNVVNFSVTNLPISISYSPEESVTIDTRDLLLQASDVTIETIIDTMFDAETSSLEREERKEKATKLARRTRDEFLDGKSYTWRFIPINFNGQTIAKLFWQQQLEDRQYPLQPTATVSLIVDSELAPIQWRKN